jgi:hypothetical protein
MIFYDFSEFIKKLNGFEREAASFVNGSAEAWQ